MKTGYIYPFYIPTTLLFNGSKIIGVLMTIYQALKNSLLVTFSTEMKNEKCFKKVKDSWAEFLLPTFQQKSGHWGHHRKQSVASWSYWGKTEMARLILSPGAAQWSHADIRSWGLSGKLVKHFLFGYFESWISITNTNNEKPIVILCCHLANNDNVSESIDCVSRDIMVVVVCK